MLRLIRKVWEDRSGPTAIEYGLIAALIAVATIAGLTSIGTALNATDNTIATTVGS
ncbi:MAG TPA: Flp family type IVb pilin [Stellaceae bacterium]|jgi:pilus assembly protein Flp/PilA|nr:Flp family type IVb pilin [Stellaceae bacterium]